MRCINCNNEVTINENGILTTNNIVHILDSHGVTYTGLNSRNCQIPGIIGARLHFLTKEIGYDLKNHNTLITSVDEKSINFTTHNFKLQQNYPNPFNSSTQIRFSLNCKSHIRIQIFNCLGEKIITLVDSKLASGNHSANWNGKNEVGIAVASGFYFVQLTTEKGNKQTNKLLFLK